MIVERHVGDPETLTEPGKSDVVATRVLQCLRAHTMRKSVQDDCQYATWIQTTCTVLGGLHMCAQL